ncbi:MAG: hypothetical protein K8H88_34825, partial [Sandaracinaceae bacterium]|nr:hypothetical protein [Sandaracinaceae bacterium]
MRGRAWLWAAVGAGLIGGCQPDPSAELLDEDDDVRWEERRARMNILVQSPAPGGGWGAPTEWTQAQLDVEAREHCLREVQATPALSGCLPGSTTCVERLCSAHVDLCLAHLYLELSRTAAPVVLRDGQGNTLRVPPQRTSTNAGLDEQALAAATAAATLAGENLRRATDPGYSYNGCSSLADLDVPFLDEDGQQVVFQDTNQSPPQNVAWTRGEVLASLLVESVDLARRAASQGLQDNSAVA